METLTTKPAVHTVDKPKKVKQPKKKAVEVALRFEVELDLSENHCNIISFPELVRRASADIKKKTAKRSSSGEVASSQTNTLDPFGDEDDDEVARIAAQFEEKYGRNSAYEDYIDKGEGYDENDSFIDNAEAYDELIPTSLTTEHDGFYINTGELKFKPVEQTGDQAANGSMKNVEVNEFETARVLQKLKRKRNRIEDDDDVNEDRLAPSKMPRKKKEPKEMKKETKMSIAEQNALLASFPYDRPQKSSTSATASSIDPSQNVAQQIPVKKYKRQQQQQQSLLDVSWYHPSFMNSMMANSYGAASSSLQAQSLVKQKKSAQQQSTAGSSGGAMNLCTNNQATSYGEGLAGKLMAPSSSEQSSSLLPPSRKSSSSSNKNKPTAESLMSSSSLAGHGPNFAMLQTLASLANSNSAGNPMSLSTSSSRIAGNNNNLSNLGPLVAAHSGHQLSRSGVTVSSPSHSVRSSAASPTIISPSSASSTLAGNPNSLLLSAVAHSAAAASKAASNSVTSSSANSSAAGGAANANNQLYNSLFTTLPNLFSTTEILNRFLSADTVASSRGSSVMGSAQQQRVAAEIAKSFAAASVGKGSPSITSSSSLNTSLLMNAAHLSNAAQLQHLQQQQLHRSNSISSSNSAVSTSVTSGLPTFITPSQHSAVARSMASSGGPVSNALMSAILSGVGQQQHQQAQQQNQHQQMPGAGGGGNQKTR